MQVKRQLCVVVFVIAILVTHRVKCQTTVQIRSKEFPVADRQTVERLVSRLNRYWPWGDWEVIEIEAPDDDDPPPPPPETEQVWLSDAVVARLTARWEGNAWGADRVRSEAAQGLSRSPQAPSGIYRVPYYNSDRSGHMREKARLQNDGIECYALVLQYLATGDARSRAKAIEYLDAWTFTRVNDDQQTRLTFSVHAIPLILAADGLSRDGWQDEGFKEWLRYAVTRTEHRNAASWSNNNRKCWATLFWAAAADYLNDAELRANAVSAWRYAVQRQITDSGEMPEETRRNRPIFYTHYALNPLAAAATIFEGDGVDVWEYDEAALKEAWYYAAREFSRDGYPSSEANIGCYELFHPRWSDPHGFNALNHHRPVAPWAGILFISLTHGVD